MEQEFTNYKTTEVHISTICAGDTVLHRGVVRTVCKKDIKYCSFMGYSLFGESYVFGTKPVLKVTFFAT